MYSVGSERMEGRGGGGEESRDKETEILIGQVSCRRCAAGLQQVSRDTGQLIVYLLWRVLAIPSCIPICRYRVDGGKLTASYVAY